MVSPIYGSSSGYQSNSLISSSGGASSIGGGGSSAQSLADQFNSTVQSTEPPKEEGGGLFDKIGATIKGVVKAPGKLVEGAVKSLTDPKTLLMGAAAIALAPVTGGGSLVALGAYGAVKSGQAVVQGAGQAIQGWQTGDLNAIENGVASAGAGAGGVALAGVGIKSAITANPSIAASTLENGFKGPAKLGGNGSQAVAVENLSPVQALRAAPEAIKTGARQGLDAFKAGGETTGARISTFKDAAIQTAKDAPGAVKSFWRDVQGYNRGTSASTLEGQLAAAKSKLASADPASRGGLSANVNRLQGLLDEAQVAAPKAQPIGEVVRGATSKEGITNAFQQAQLRLNNSRIGDAYHVLEGKHPGAPAIFGSVAAGNGTQQPQIPTTYA